jgi:hypothetical protein
MMSRRVNADHGATLEVYGVVDGVDRELLKFDCFVQNPHWHRCYPDRADAIAQLAPATATQALAFAIETLGTRLGRLLTEQGYGALSPAADDPAVGRALTQVATTMTALLEGDPATL